MCWGYTYHKMLILVVRESQRYYVHPFIQACGALIFTDEDKALRFLEHYAGANGHRRRAKGG